MHKDKAYFANTEQLIYCINNFINTEYQFLEYYQFLIKHFQLRNSIHIYPRLVN